MLCHKHRLFLLRSDQQSPHRGEVKSPASAGSVPCLIQLVSNLRQIVPLRRQQTGDPARLFVGLVLAGVLLAGGQAALARLHR